MPPRPKASVAFSRSVLLYIVFILIPFGCLVVPVFPDVFLIQTKFDGSSTNVTIGDSQGVTKIQWGIWKACYDYKNDGRQCTIEVSLKHSFQHPYTFTVENENNAGASVTVKEWWVRSMYLQFFSVFVTFVPTFFIGNCCGMQRAPYRYYLCMCRNHHGLLGDADEYTLYVASHKGRNRIFLYWTLLTVVMLLAMFGLYVNILNSIRKEMESLGNAASVKTHVLPGYVFTMFAAWYLVLGGLIISSCAQSDIKFAEENERLYGNSAGAPNWAAGNPPGATGNPPGAAPPTTTPKKRILGAHNAP